VIRASAENLPLADGSFDAALAVNTVHHWTDVRAALRELRRVARKRIVVFLRDPSRGAPFWLTEEYLPSLDPSSKIASIVAILEDELAPVDAVPFALPRDCADGLLTAYWGQPEMYLDAAVRKNISNFALAAEDDVARGVASLRADLDSGAWDRKHGHLRSLAALDVGHRALVAELIPETPPRLARSIP
jgi:SAM-dependent methyltransferase